MALRSTAEQADPRAGRTIGVDAQLARKCTAEFLGTTILVFVGAGVATVMFGGPTGFRGYGASVAAGTVAVALAFGLVLIGLVAMIGPISGCHVNPAVTLGAYLTKRIQAVDAVGYVLAQLIGGIIGALLLLWVLHSSPLYAKSRNGLGANGYGSLSLLHISGGGAFLAEVILTAIFVLIVLSATRKEASVAVGGVVMGMTLGVANLVAVPIDGASINPARSLGPALITGGLALSQVWLFLFAPLVGAVLAAGIYLLFHQVPASPGPSPLIARLRGEPVVTHASADEELRPASQGAAGAATTSGGGAGAAAARADPADATQAPGSGEPPPGPLLGPGEPPPGPLLGTARRTVGLGAASYHEPDQFTSGFDLATAGLAAVLVLAAVLAASWSITMCCGPAVAQSRHRKGRRAARWARRRSSLRRP